MKSTESNSSPEPEEVQSMVCYAKNLIEEFRRAKHYKNILFPPTFPLSLVFFFHSRLLFHIHLWWVFSSRFLRYNVLFFDSVAPPSELLEMCELSLEKMGSVFADTNVYMLHMMYQAMGVCLYMQDWDGAMSYGEKIIQPYRYNRL